MSGDFELEPYSKKTSYQQWQEAQGIPIIKGYLVEDLNEVPLEPWERKGGRGALISLEGNEETDDAYLCEIPPSSSLKPQKHLFEEMIYVLNGRGSTAIWNEIGEKRAFEWKQGSLFSPPLNTWHQHTNSGNEPVKYLAVTTAPSVINLFHNIDFVFNNSFVFKDRYDEKAGDFSAEGRMLHTERHIWEGNLVPDVRTCELYEHNTPAGIHRTILLQMSDNTLCAHVSEVPVGYYREAHRHYPGAVVVILSGHGYTLLWPPDGGARMRIDWRQNSLFVPPGGWFHQLFNTSKEPARDLGLRWGGLKHRSGKQWKENLDVKLGGDKIVFADEEPEIRKLYETELAKAKLT